MADVAPCLSLDHERPCSERLLERQGTVPKQSPSVTWPERFSTRTSSLVSLTSAVALAQCTYRMRSRSPWTRMPSGSTFEDLPHEALRVASVSRSTVGPRSCTRTACPISVSSSVTGSWVSAASRTARRSAELFGPARPGRSSPARLHRSSRGRREDRVEPEPTLVGRGGVLLVGVRVEQGAVDVDHDVVGCAPAVQAGAGASARAAAMLRRPSEWIESSTRHTVGPEPTRPNSSGC